MLRRRKKIKFWNKSLRFFLISGREASEKKIRNSCTHTLTNTIAIRKSNLKNEIFQLIFLHVVAFELVTDITLSTMPLEYMHGRVLSTHYLYTHIERSSVVCRDGVNSLFLSCYANRTSETEYSAQQLMRIYNRHSIEKRQTRRKAHVEMERI